VIVHLCAQHVKSFQTLYSRCTAAAINARIPWRPSRCAGCTFSGFNAPLGAGALLQDVTAIIINTNFTGNVAAPSSAISAPIAGPALSLSTIPVRAYISAAWLTNVRFDGNVAAGGAAVAPVSVSSAGACRVFSDAADGSPRVHDRATDTVAPPWRLVPSNAAGAAQNESLPFHPAWFSLAWNSTFLAASTKPVRCALPMVPPLSFSCKPIAICPPCIRGCGAARLFALPCSGLRPSYPAGSALRSDR
jgi:hypothetical protein